MKKRKYVKSILANLLFSSLCVGIATTPLTINKNIDISKNNSSTNDLSDAKAAQTPGKITSFQNYDIMSNSKDYAPVVTETGILGITSDKKTLTVTSYDGVLVWEKKLSEDEQVKAFYQKNYNSEVNKLNNYQVKNYIYLSVVNVLAVLFGDQSNNHQILLGLDFNTGVIYEPIKGKDTIVKAKDGLTQLYLNSDNNILGTAGKEFSNYKNTTQTFTMNPKQGISEIGISITNSIGIKENDYFIHLVQGGNNVNFAVFISHDYTQNDGFKVYMVAVDNYLVPIIKNSSKVTQDIGFYKRFNNGQDIDWNEIIRYQPLSVIYNKNDIIFTTIVQGEKSSFAKWGYTFGNKTFTKKWSIDFEGKKSINTFVYDYLSRKLFLSYKKSEDGTAIERYDIDSASQPKAEVLEKTTDTNYWNKDTKEFINPVLVAPVIPSKRLDNPNPYIILYKNKDPQGRYFTSGTEVFTTSLVFKRYENPKDRIIANEDIYKKSIPSSITNNKLLDFISFSQSLSGFEKRIEQRKNDDDNGTLYFEYKISYTNWYDKTSKTTITIPVSLIGMYSKNSKYSFNFVTSLTGNPENDSKYKKQREYIEGKFVSELTKQQVLDSFFIYNIFDIDGTKINIQEKDISIAPINSGYGAQISVRIKSDKLPKGLNDKTYTQTYTGFKTVAGYEFGLTQNSEEANAIKAKSYPSELTEYDFLHYFVNLGNKWNTDLDKWDFQVSSNNYTGSVYVTLTYTGNETDFPNGQVKKDLLNSQEIGGFKTIPQQFNQDNLRIDDYNGSATPSALWVLYQKDKENSLLAKSIHFPYINNNKYLEITANNESTMDEDEYIDLTISLVDNAQTTLPVSNVNGNPFFIYNEEAKPHFQDVFPFHGRWNIRNVNHNFEWVTNSGITVPADGDLNIDLDKESYDGINKSMYANEVKEEAIDKLFKYQYYDVAKEIIPNITKGTLKVIITLKNPQQKYYANTFAEDNSNSNVKIINISHFKLPTPPLLGSIPAIILMVLGFTMVAISIAVVIYIFAKRKYTKLSKPKKIIKK